MSVNLRLCPAKPCLLLHHGEVTCCKLGTWIRPRAALQLCTIVTSGLSVFASIIPSKPILKLLHFFGDMQLAPMQDSPVLHDVGGR